MIFGVLMVISLVGAGIFVVISNDPISADVAGSSETIAKVSSERVTVGDLTSLQEGQMGRLPSKYLIDSLVSQRIIRIEANKLGLRASDAEVAAEIRKQLKSEDGTVIDQKRYEENVAMQYGSVAAYEQTVRDQISSRKLQAFLTAGVSVSEEEVLKDYQRKNTKFDVNYVSVNAAELSQTLKPTDAEMQEYFDKNKATYYINSPQKKIRYVFLNTTKVGEKIPLTEEELKGEYEKIPADKKSKGVEAQQIVFRIAKPEFKAQTLEKANQVVQRARQNGNVVTEEAFAELVRGYSEDSVSRAANGKLPALVRDNPNLRNTPNAVLPPQQTVLGMKDGEVSEPIESGNNYFVFRRGKDVPKTYEDAKPEIEISLRNRKAYAVTAELAQKVVDDLKQTKDVDATAKKFAGEANMSVADMIRETPFVKPGDNVDNIGISPQFEEGIKNLENANDVGERTPIQNGFAIPLLVERKDPRDATLDEVKTQVADAVKLDKARSMVEEIAKQIASGATGAADLNTAATAKGLKAQDQKGFILGSPLGQGPSASTSEDLENAVYALKQGETTKTPVKIGENYFIVGVTKREDANMTEYATKRDELFESMVQQKRGVLFSDYLATTRRKLEASGDIKIYNELIEKIDAQNAANNPQPQIPNMPFPMQ